jgi:hypothetical protein
LGKKRQAKNASCEAQKSIFGGQEEETYLLKETQRKESAKEKEKQEGRMSWKSRESDDSGKECQMLLNFQKGKISGRMEVMGEL